MKKGAGVGIIGREKESEQGLHFTSSPMGSPCHTNVNDSASGPPLINTQSIYSNSNKKLSKVLIYAQNCHWLELHQIEDKDKFKAAVAQYFSQQPVFTAKELHQPYSFHPF